LTSGTSDGRSITRGTFDELDYSFDAVRTRHHVRQEMDA
jgi:hypothetical protein